MDTQKNNQVSSYTSSKETSTKNKLQVQEFFTDVKSELHKIHWTSYNELISYTKIVVGATFFMGMAIYGMDLLIQSTLDILKFGFRLITG
ncbi:MAG: preprotein translocase subunit SecE [Chlamydia sp. 32-24]|nr:MAG: preprotein translocase subunit SecE [Chlamydia sp. 32-24]